MRSSLICRLKHADEPALAELWSVTCDSLLRYAQRMFNGSNGFLPDAESAVQSAFVSLWKGLKDERFEFEDGHSLRAIMFTLVRRKVIKQMRIASRPMHGGNVTHVRIDDRSDKSPVIDIPVATPSPSLTAEAKEEVERLMDLLADRQLQQLVLLKMDRRTDQEVADHLRTSRATVARKLALIRSIWQADAAESID
jgi:RNA polymerase sigma factor (sigma-70 family)